MTISVFEDEADEVFDESTMDKERLEYLKNRRQSRQLHAKVYRIMQYRRQKKSFSSSKCML